MHEQRRYEISRRKLLRGLGAGAVLLAPFARNRLADAAPAGNFFYFFSPNGHVRSDFGGQGSTTSDFTLLPSLAPLESLKSNIITLRGICNKTSSYYNSHEDACKTLSMYFGSGDYQTTYGPSFDQELALALNAPKPLTLGVQPMATIPFIYCDLSWVAAGKTDPKFTDSMSAYNAAFGGGIMPQTDAGAAAMAALIADRKSALDFVMDDISRFSARLSSTDKQNLDLYLTSVRGIENKLAQGASSSAAPTCDSTGTKSHISSTNAATGFKFQQEGEVMVDIALTAMACGLRRISTLCWQQGAGGVNPLRSGSDPDHHQVSHGDDGGTVAEWKSLDSWYASRFAYTISRMQTLGIIDNTVVVWGSEISEAHNQIDQAIVVAGGKGLGLKLGKNVTYPFYGDNNITMDPAHALAVDSRHASLADLYVSIQKALGVNKDYVGDKQYCKGGLTEVF